MEKGVPFLDLSAQYHILRDELDAAIREVLQSGQFILGRQVSAMEEEFASYLAAAHAVGVASGTDALLLALVALGTRPGDEVITSAFSFIAVPEVLSYLGAVPVFVDIHPETYTLDAKLLEASLTPRTRGIVPVHLFGHPADMDPIMAFARRNGLWVVEDCAQAAGATYRGRKVGTIGDVGCFSFFPTKNLGAFGDGGMVVTSNEELAGRVRLLRNHGATDEHQHGIIGYNSRLDELQAAILRVKLKRLDEWIMARRRLAGRYASLLEGQPVGLPIEASYGRHAYNQYTVRLQERDGCRQALRALGVATKVYYYLALPSQPSLGGLGCRVGDFRESVRAAREVLSLPIYPEMRSDQVEAVCKGLAAALKACSRAD